MSGYRNHRNQTVTGPLVTPDRTVTTVTGPLWSRHWLRSRGRFSSHGLTQSVEKGMG